MTFSASPQKVLEWLAKDALPLWSIQGFDHRFGCFHENLSRVGIPLSSPRRVMVQARQIYAFAEASRLQLITKAEAQKFTDPAADYMVEKYSLPSGAFRHSVDENGLAAVNEPDLYAQAFALFGLAQAYELSGTKTLRERAHSALRYLQKERRAPGGGYTELASGQITMAANPHMHLLEAALAWVRVDADRVWRDLVTELFELCMTRFIDAETGALCEHFTEGWKPRRENGLFVFEPGHHFEWAWLLWQTKRALGLDAGTALRKLFDVAEQSGVDAQTGLAWDEVWSNGQIKRASSRFWPQGERVKAAVVLGEAQIADQAMTSLFRFLNRPAPGLWEDTLAADGTFKEQPVKASSFYHIINAIAEYVAYRPTLKS